MPFNKILFAGYNVKNSVNFQNNYSSVPSDRIGSSVNNFVSITPLYDAFDVQIGQIQFNSVKFYKSTYPVLYNVCEEIIIQLDNGSVIFANNYYKSNTETYPDGSKQIVPITSCIGSLDYVGRDGYIVIDVNGDNHAIAIGLN